MFTSPTSYSEKLKDPRWQKKRLEILNRDHFTCTNCEETTKTLHVHHILYHSGKDPWDYPESDLETLCVDCHEIQTSFDRHLKEQEALLVAAFRDLEFSERMLFPVNRITPETLRFLVKIMAAEQ